MLRTELVKILAHGIAKGATGLLGGVHVGDFALYQLKLTDRLAELFTLVDIRDHLVHHCLHNAQWAGR